jgi:hypothetical protein
MQTAPETKTSSWDPPVQFELQLNPVATSLGQYVTMGIQDKPA